MSSSLLPLQTEWSLPRQKQTHVEVRDHLFWVGSTGEAISEDTSGLTGNRPDGNGSMLPGLRLVTDDSQLMLRSLAVTQRMGNGGGSVGTVFF